MLPGKTLYYLGLSFSDNLCRGKRCPRINSTTAFLFVLRNPLTKARVARGEKHHFRLGARLGEGRSKVRGLGYCSTVAWPRPGISLSTASLGKETVLLPENVSPKQCGLLSECRSISRRGSLTTTIPAMSGNKNAGVEDKCFLLPRQLQSVDRGSSKSWP